jgi:hypothetical protein
MHEELPTAPGLRVSNLRIHRAYERTFDDMAFDLPVNATMYVGVRKSVLKAHRRQTEAQAWVLIGLALMGLALYALVELSYHGWL